MKNKKKIYVKEVDRSFNPKAKTCFGESAMEKSLVMKRLGHLYDVQYSDDPDIVIAYMPGARETGIEYDKYRDKILLQFVTESAYPDFSVFDYAVSPHHRLQLKQRFLYLPTSLVSCGTTRKSYDLMRVKHMITDEQKMVNRNFCSFTVSNGYDAAWEREQFFHMLSAYKKIDSGGAFLNNIGYKVPNKLEFDRKHKFSIAFENMKDSFISEKLDMAFAGQTVPIYWGNEDITDVYNPKAFVNCYDYDSFEQVIEKIKEIDQDDELYLSMLKQPALLEDRSQEYYIKKLDQFLVDIVENGRSYRCDYSWSKIMQDVRADGMKKLYHRRFLRNTILNSGRILLYPVRKARPILKIKDKLYRRR